MSNLKKILALVLALVMSFSLVTVSSAAYEDQDEIGADYLEAVTVLTNLGIFKGDNLGNFNPQAYITRQEVAAMMYRVISGDTADANDELYVDACVFEDGVANWAKGYVGYCANGGYVKGVGGPNFDPEGNISGIAVLAMILRAVGYDKNNEFTGPTWENSVLTVATDLGVLSGIDETVGSLRQYATRELVAELIFRAMVKATKVTYTPAFSYQPIVENIGVNNVGAQPATIGYDNFGLLSKQLDDVDVWGNPNHNWLIDVNENRVADDYDLANGVVASFTYPVIAEYTVATRECDVAHALKYSVANENNIPVVVNGQTLPATVAVNPVDTINTIGAQGRLTKVYDYKSREDGKTYEKITMVDTFLAEVDSVIPATYDKAGHLKTYAYLTLNVYDQVNNGFTQVTKAAATNFTYVKGDMLLVNAYTAGANATGATGTVLLTNTATAAYLPIVQYAESFEGNQTIFWNNLDKHTVNGVDYNDANSFYLDEAGVEITAHTWYKDTYGNLIGAADIATKYTYGVLSSLWWVNDGSNFGKGVAYGTITYMDGTVSDVVEIAAINGLATDYSQDVIGATDLTTATKPNGTPDVFYVSTFGANNTVTFDHLYRIQTLADGSLSLVELAQQVDATVTNKLTMINGTVDTIDNYEYNGTTKDYDAVTTTSVATVYADNFTQYLVYNPVTKTVATYTGIENIPSFTDAANNDITVDYVDFDADGWVDFVYIIGRADAATDSEFVFVTNRATSAQLNPVAGGIYYWTVYGVVHADGSTEPLKTTSTAIKNELIASEGTLFYVETTNGYVTNIVAIDDTGCADTLPATQLPLWAEFEGKASYTSADGVNGVLRTSLIGDFTDTKYYNVNAANTLVIDEDGLGSISDLNPANLAGKYVYVVSYAAAGASGPIANAIFISSVDNDVNSTDLTSVVVKGVAATETAANEYAINLADSVLANTALVDIMATTESPNATVKYFLSGDHYYDDGNETELTAGSMTNHSAYGSPYFLIIEVTAQDGTKVYNYVTVTHAANVTTNTTGVIAGVAGNSTVTAVDEMLDGFAVLSDAEIEFTATQQAALTIAKSGSVISVSGNLTKNSFLKNTVAAGYDYFILLSFLAPAGFEADTATWNNNGTSSDVEDGVFNLVLCLTGTDKVLSRTITWTDANGNTVDTNIVLDLNGISFK